MRYREPRRTSDRVIAKNPRCRSRLLTRSRPTGTGKRTTLCGSANDFDPSPVGVSESVFPLDLDVSDYQPGGSAAVAAGVAYVDHSDTCDDDGKLEASVGDLADGLHWVPCDVVIKGGGSGSNVTVVSSVYVVGGSDFMLDLAVKGQCAPADCASGPIPGRAVVMDDDGELSGELLIWVDDGYLSGLEFAWFSDDKPAELPDESAVRLV